MHIGWSRFRSAAAPIAVVGVLGTFLTVAAGALLAHMAFGWPGMSRCSWPRRSPRRTRRWCSLSWASGRSPAARNILKGESGANDPVGIALMAGLIAAGGLSAGAFAKAGAGFGVRWPSARRRHGGRPGLLWFTRRVPLPSEGLYPLRSLAGALLIYGVATLAHGSGFLAVFIAGIVLGDEPVPSSGRSSGSTRAGQPGRDRRLRGPRPDDQPVRDRPGRRVGPRAHPRRGSRVRHPAAAGRAVPLPARLDGRERAFILFAGLKGAVPILLGSFLLATHIPDAERYTASS